MAEQNGLYTIPARRLPSLDGIRGVAIVLVLISHAELFGDTPLGEWVARLGDLGVKMFFVLSGFLITTLLVNEQRRTGRIAIGRFVVRRAFRIFPAAYVFMLSIILAAKLGWVTLHTADTFHALTYTIDFEAAPSWWLGHLWSLAIEEQFYIVWPVALWLARPRGGAYVMIATLIVAPIVRGVMVTHYPGLTEGIERAFITAVDGFAAGGLLAIVRVQLERHGGYMRALRARWVMALVPLAAILNQFEHHPLAFYGLLQSLVYLTLAFCLHHSQVVPDGPSGRLLNSTQLAWLGSISYSLYLWQQPFLAPASESAFRNFPLAVTVSVCFALLSYHLIEQPFLRLRDRRLASPRAFSGASSPGPHAAAVEMAQ